MVKETSLMQLIVLSPERVCPGLQFTSTTVPTITGNLVVVVMSDTAAGSALHVSEGERFWGVIQNQRISYFVINSNFSLNGNQL